MKIVQKKEKEGKLIETLNFNTHVESVSKISEKIAQRIIYAKDGKISFHNKPLNGKVYITYPLSVIVELEINNIKSVGSLLWNIAQAYKEIYLKEKETSEIKTIPVEDRECCMNRNQTDGEYGIWGHDIEDLYFENIDIYDNGVINLGMGS